MIYQKRDKRGLCKVSSTSIATFSLLAGLLGAFFVLAVPAYADGGAPQRAYVAGSSAGVSVISIPLQKVTSTIQVSPMPSMVLLSPDARFLYAAESQQNRVAVIAAATGQTFCTANVAGQPKFLALDTTSGAATLFAAGNGAASVTAIDPTNCSIKHTYPVNGGVYGLAVAQVGAALNGASGSQLWVSDSSALDIFDIAKNQKLGSITVPGGPGYISIPPGATVYATTRQGSVIALDLNSRQQTTLVTGGSYGPMDYDATTGEVYVPDRNGDQVLVLAPVSAGSATPKEPSRTISMHGVAPASIAITSDGQLGFVALESGDVAMLDLPGRQTVTTIHVGGSPGFIITGLNPPLVGTTPQQASQLTTLATIGAYVLIALLLIVPILIFRRYLRVEAKKDKQ
jgi:DNA-binding beta-propeller fold protein YncE